MAADDAGLDRAKPLAADDADLDRAKPRAACDAEPDRAKPRAAGGAELDRAKPRGATRVLLALGASGRGLAGAFRNEAAFRQELALALLVIPLASWLARSGVERALLIAPMLLVLVVELVNSAIETAVDRIGLERHTLSGLAKDIGSAAVFMSFMLLGCVWLLVLLGR